jgi:hypothetical protein
MPRPRKSRIYWKNGRAHADFRDFAPWGGRQEALRPEGTGAATSDHDEAMRLCASRLAELEAAKRAVPRARRRTTRSTGSPRSRGITSPLQLQQQPLRAAVGLAAAARAV